VWSRDVGFAIKSLWNDKGIQEVYKGAGKTFHLNDTASFFFENIDRFIGNEYVPTVEDVLRVRVMSTGIEEAEFNFDNLIFKVVDVGGQKSERRKWVHCFECVTTVLFCASLSSYYQTLREDNETNRMMDTFSLFEETVNNPVFKEATFILFLNKIDLFGEKIGEIGLNTCAVFGDYKQGADYEAALNFVKEKFLEKIREREKKMQIHVHFTCALDTKNIEVVMDHMRNVILSKIAGQIVF